PIKRDISPHAGRPGPRNGLQMTGLSLARAAGLVGLAVPPDFLILPVRQILLRPRRRWAATAEAPRSDCQLAVTSMAASVRQGRLSRKLTRSRQGAERPPATKAR